MYFKTDKQVQKIIRKMKNNEYDLDIIKTKPSCFEGMVTKNEYYKSLTNMFIDKGYYLYDTEEKNVIVKCYFEKQDNYLYIIVYESFYDIYFEIRNDIDKIDADVNINDKLIPKGMKYEIMEIVKELSKLVLAHISCVNYYATNTNIIRQNTIEKKTVINKSKSSNKNNKKKNNKKVRKIIMSNRVINVPNNVTDIEIKRGYTRRTESWKVKGFWRTYKSGKKVWIKPSVRGNKNVKNINANIYELKGEITNEF